MSLRPPGPWPPTESFAEFRDKAAAEGPLSMLIDGLVSTGAVGVVAAVPKAMKTWLTLDLAVCVSTGTPVLGRFKVPWPVPVLYVAAEGQRGSIRDRLEVLARGHGIDPTTAAALAGLHFWYRPAGLDLTKPEHGAELVKRAKDVGAGLVVLDVLRRVARVRETGEGAQDFADVLDGLAPLTAEGVAVMVVHHMKKGSGKADGPFFEQISGSGGVFSSADLAIMLRNPGTDATTGRPRATLTFEGRDLAFPDDINIRLTGEGSGANGTLIAGDTATIETTGHAAPGEFRPTTLMERVSEYLAGVEPQSKNSIERGVTGNRDAIRRALELLIRDGHVTEITGAGQHPKFTLERAYRQDEDPLSDTFSDPPSPTSPNLAQTSPRANLTDLAHSPTHLRGGEGRARRTPARTSTPTEGELQRWEQLAHDPDTGLPHLPLVTDQDLDADPGPDPRDDTWWTAAAAEAPA